MTVYIRQAETPALVLEGQSLVIYAEQVQQRRLEIMHMHRVLSDIVPKVVRLSVQRTWLNPGPGHPDSKTPGVMITPVAGFSKFTLGISSPSKLAYLFDPQHTQLCTLQERCPLPGSACGFD